MFAVSRCLWQWGSHIMIYSKIYFFIGIVFIAALQCLSPRVVVAGSQGPQYLIFQMFLGGPGGGDVFRRGATKDDMLQFARRIKDTVRPTSVHPNRILGFSIGPITMDEGENDVRSVIRDAFDVALATDMAVALHLDDYMMWAQARLPDGRLLRTVQGSAEWSDWSRTPAGRLQIGWLANAQLAPQLCYENPEVKDFTVHWTRDVIGREVRQQFDRLVQAGKEKLFAGVIIGWKSNLAQGYCSLSYLGYSGRNPPADFDREREQILQRHIERWAKGIL